MKERTKRLCDSIIALSLAVSVLSSAAAIKTYSARLDIARPGVTAFADGEEPTGDEPTTGEEPAGEESAVSVRVYAQVAGSGALYPEDGLSVTETDGSFTVNVADLKVPDDTESGKAGEVFKGWALKDGGVVVTEVGKNDFMPVDDKSVVTLFPVWGAPEPTRDGAKGGEGGEEGEGEGEQESELTEAEKKQLVVEAQARIDNVRGKADAAIKESEKADPSREAMEGYLTADPSLDDQLKTAEANLKKAGKVEGYTRANADLARAKTELKAAQDAMAKIPTANDKNIVTQMKAKFKAAKESAENAKTAAEEQDADEFDSNYSDAVGSYVNAIDMVDGADDPSYVYGAVDTEMKAAESAMKAAQAAYNKNVYVAMDPKTNLQYTLDQLNLVVTQLPENHKVYTAAANEYKNDDQFFHAFEVKWVTKSGNKEVEMDPENGPYAVYVDLGSASAGSMKESTLSLTRREAANGSKISGESYPINEKFHVECNSNRYDLYFDTVMSGCYVFGGSYYPDAETDADGNVVKDKDGNPKTYVAKDENGDPKTQEEVDSQNMIVADKIADGSSEYKAVAAALPSSAKPLAMYDIHFNNDGAAVLAGKQVKVKLKVDDALKGKKVSVYHLVGSNMKYTAQKVTDATVPSTGDNAGIIEFYASGFSPYAVTEYTPASSSSGDSSSTGTGLTSPRTGEGSPLPFVLAAVGALAVAGGVIVWRKKKTAQD